MKRKDVIYIFSGELQSNDSYQNAIATAWIESYLQVRGVPHSVVIGSYKGATERSFLVVGQQFEELVLEVASMFKQESILKSYSDRETFLKFLDTSKQDEVSIGKLMAVDESEAKGLDAWTFCPKLNRYFTTK